MSPYAKSWCRLVGYCCVVSGLLSAWPNTYALVFVALYYGSDAWYSYCKFHTQRSLALDRHIQSFCKARYEERARRWLDGLRSNIELEAMPDYSAGPHRDPYVDWVCPHCGYTASQAGHCPHC